MLYLTCVKSWGGERTKEKMPNGEDAKQRRHFGWEHIRESDRLEGEGQLKVL